MILALAIGSQLHSAPGVVLATGVSQHRHVFSLADHRGARQRRRRRQWPAARRWHLQRRLGFHECPGPFRRRHAGGEVRVQNHFLPAAWCFCSRNWFWFSGWKSTCRTLPRPSAEPAPAPSPDPNRPSPAKAQGVPAHGVAGQSVRLHRHQHLHSRCCPGLAARFHLTPMFAGFACSLWGFVRFGTFIDAMVLDRLALPFPLAGDGVRHAHRFVRGHSHRAQSRGVARGANFLRRAPSG